MNPFSHIWFEIFWIVFNSLLIFGTRNRRATSSNTVSSVWCGLECGDWARSPCPSKPPCATETLICEAPQQERRHQYKGTSRPLVLDFLGFICSWIKEVFHLHFKKSVIKNNYPPPSVFLLATNESDYGPWWAPASRGLVAPTTFEVSRSNFIRRILSGISGACWKLLMTDVSPHCHTPCIIWFGKQHTAFCSISMSQTVCKQLVITQFSENHYFPMKCWTLSKLGFGMASAAPTTRQRSPLLQVHVEGKAQWGLGGGAESRWGGVESSLCPSALWHGTLTKDGRCEIWSERKQNHNVLQDRYHTDGFIIFFITN